MGDVNLEIKLSNLDERVIKIEETGGGSGGDDYITSVSNDFNVVNKKLSLSNDVTTKLSKVDIPDNLSVELAKKIDKPASATNGQVLTYNGTDNVWEAQNSKGGDLSDVYGTSDLWSSKTSWAKDEICIDENKLWKCLISNSDKPSENDKWTQITLKSLNNLTTKKEFIEIARTTSTSMKTITIPNGIKISDYNFITVFSLGSGGAVNASLTVSTDIFKNYGAVAGNGMMASWVNASGTRISSNVIYKTDTSIEINTSNSSYYAVAVLYD